MRKFWKLMVVSVVVFGLVTVSASAAEKNLNLTWGELQPFLIGKKVVMMLRDGNDVEGKVLSVLSEWMEVDVKSSSRYSKGIHRVGRSEVAVIRVRQIKGPWRTIATAIGAGGGLTAGLCFYSYANAEANPEMGGAVAAALVGGGAAGGYFVGRGIDTKTLVISVEQ